MRKKGYRRLQARMSRQEEKMKFVLRCLRQLKPNIKKGKRTPSKKLKTKTAKHSEVDIKQEISPSILDDPSTIKKEVGY